VLVVVLIRQVLVVMAGMVELVVVVEVEVQDLLVVEGVMGVVV
jgi:hypothetical protein